MQDVPTTRSRFHVLPFATVHHVTACVPVAQLSVGKYSVTDETAVL